MTVLQSWASFEPTKTTVKRVLLQENQKKNVNKSFLLKDREIFSSGLGDISTVHQEDQTSRSFLHPLENKGELLQSLDETACAHLSSKAYEENAPDGCYYFMFKQAFIMDPLNKRLRKKQPFHLNGLLILQCHHSLWACILLYCKITT